MIFFDIELFDYKYLIFIFENFQKVLIIKKEDLKEIIKLKNQDSILKKIYILQKKSL